MSCLYKPVPVGGYPSVYSGRRSLYYENVPLWSEQYRFCSSSQDCVDVPGRPRCLGLQFPMTCESGCTKDTGSCVCSSSLLAARFHKPILRK